MTVVFLTFHGIGHFNATFRIARGLSKSHTVIFAGFPMFRNYVEGQGFRFYPLESVPFGLGFEEWVNEREKKKNVWLASLRDRWNGRLFFQRDRELQKLIDELQPTSIFVDAQQPTDFVVLYPHAKARLIKVAILHTMLPQVLRRGYPPGNSLMTPDRPLEVFYATTAYRCRRALRKMMSFLKYLGKTNESMIMSIMRANGTPLSYLSASVSHLSVHINGPDEFILSPDKFDFNSPARSSAEHYVGFMPDTHRREFVSAPVADLLTHVDHTKLPLVYCSLGTVSGGDRHLVNSFLKRFCEAVAGLPVLVALSTVATGGPISQQLPSNVHVFNPAPQLALLGKASVFVTHGGLNSIKEAIHAGVPMIVYPRDPRLDQNGNATRIVFGKLGLRGNIRKDSAADISSNIAELIQNPAYRKAVNAFKALDSTYTDEGFLKLFGKVKLLY